MPRNSIPDQLDWFTAKILPDGAQEIVIRALPVSPGQASVRLDRSQSQTLTAILDQIARDTTLPWSTARQAVLRGFWTALHVDA
ncbi:hypothetical protein FM996_18140 [Methylosinus sporium]|uniref:Uncharacterized protein n=1 Tax=Methylosinus sporium TaxID=428 RepID=A0A549SH94_METSR|nr:hypothetical protein [Methylosinus sporium]TRL28993.1 hypothetical protein FM996_18140 [Methylosinus sporium]